MAAGRNWIVRGSEFQASVGVTMRGYDRRDFPKVTGAASAATLLGGRVHALAAALAEPARSVAASDRIQIALIGAAGRDRAISAPPSRLPASSV